MRYSSGARFSRAKPPGGFRVYHPSSRRVAAHANTLREARIDAAFWSKQSPNPIEIQKRFPSGEWVAVETVRRKFPKSATTRTAGSKRAHAVIQTKPSGKTHAKTRDDMVTIDQLAEMLGLPAWDKVDEHNQQHYWEMSRGAEDEDAQMEAEREAQEEVYRQWYDAVEHVAEKLLGEHGLELLAMKHTRKVHANHRPHQLKVIPTKSWTDAADKIRETLNGVGTFYFNDLKEFLDSGPYTARQAVLAHLRTVQSYPAVYGGPGANQLYNQYWH